MRAGTAGHDGEGWEDAEDLVFGFGRAIGIKGIGVGLDHGFEHRIGSV